MIPGADLAPINAPRVLYRYVRELQLPGELVFWCFAEVGTLFKQFDSVGFVGVIFGLTMQLFRLCQPEMSILDGRELVGPEVNIMALMTIALKLCYGLDESAENM